MDIQSPLFKAFFVHLIFFSVAFSAEAKTIHSFLRENFKMTFSADKAESVLLYVREGQWVKEGDKLFGRDQEELELKRLLAELQYRQAKVKLEKLLKPQRETEIQQAKLKLEQSRTQFQAGGISKDAFELASLEYDLATIKSRPEDIRIARMDIQVKKVQLDLAEQSLKKASFFSPVSGKVNKLLIHRNEWVKAGQEIVELININPLYVFIHLPIEYLDKVKKRQKLTIKISRNKKLTTTRGRVRHIYDEVDPVSQTIRIRIEINNKKHRFKPGMRAQVVLPW